MPHSFTAHFFAFFIGGGGGAAREQGSGIRDQEGSEPRSRGRGWVRCGRTPACTPGGGGGGSVRQGVGSRGGGGVKRGVGSSQWGEGEGGGE